VIFRVGSLQNDDKDKRTFFIQHLVMSVNFQAFLDYGEVVLRTQALDLRAQVSSLFSFAPLAHSLTAVSDTVYIVV